MARLSCGQSRHYRHGSDDEEQRPLLQGILEAAVDGRWQAAVDVKEQQPLLQDIFRAAIDGHHV